jgi:hypothetical protein
MAERGLKLAHSAICPLGPAVRTRALPADSIADATAELVLAR